MRALFYGASTPGADAVDGVNDDEILLRMEYFVNREWKRVCCLSCLKRNVLADFRELQRKGDFI